MSYMTQNECGKANTLPKIKHYAEYTIICIHYLIWAYIVLETSNEIAMKNSTQRNSEEKHTTISRKVWDSTMDNNTIIPGKQEE